MLLQNIIDNDLFEIRHEEVTNWQDALHQAANKLIEHNYIKEGYVNEVIKNVNDNGFYIVIVPGVAMPHAMAESENVLGTGIGFTKFDKPVTFDKNDPDSQAQLFFTLAAKNYDQHLKNVSELSELLMTDGLIDELLTIEKIEDFKNIINEYK